MNRNQAMLYEAASILKAKPAELRERALAVMSEQRQLQQLIEKYKSREAASEAERFLFGAREVGGVKVITAICGGKGGGKPDSAMGGGSDLLKLDDAMAAVDNFVASKLGL